MYRSATLAIVVSSTSMNVGTTTATATNQGLIAGRLTVVGARAALLMWGLLRQEERRRVNLGLRLGHPSMPAGARGQGGDPLRGSRGVGHGGALREWVKRLQDVPGVRPRGPFLVVDVGDHRQADEQRGLVRIVVGQLHADRQALDDLHEVARGILQREQGEGLTGPHCEAGDAALVLTPAAVHVDLAAHPLADAQVRELGLLEVAIDPDLGERADDHQALPHLDVVPGFTLRRVTTPSISLTTSQ